jgi:hypothetical protein
MIFTYKSDKEIQYEKDLQKYKEIPFIFRIFFKKPKLVRENINCRCLDSITLKYLKNLKNKRRRYE